MTCSVVSAEYAGRSAGRRCWAIGIPQTSVRGAPSKSATRLANSTRLQLPALATWNTRGPCSRHESRTGWLNCARPSSSLPMRSSFASMSDRVGKYAAAIAACAISPN